MLPEPGTKLPPLRIEAVSPQTMKAWAPILRDPNPIHLDRAAVRAKGLGDKLINQGPINIAWVINMLHSAFPTGEIVSLSNRFVANVYEGDAVVAAGEITATDATNKRLTCTFALTAEGRGDVVTGEAVIALPAQEEML